MSRNAQELLARIDEGEELDEDDERYLRDRAMLPEDYDSSLNDELSTRGHDLDNIANTGDANTTGLTVKQLERLLEKAKADQGMVDPDTDPSGESYEDYDEGWNNDSRREELQRRGLATNGDKAELIKRLRVDDGTWDGEE